MYLIRDPKMVGKMQRSGLNWLLTTARDRMGTRGYGATFLFVVFPLLLSSPYHKPRLKKLSSKAEGGRDLSQFYFGEKFCCLYGT